MALVNAIGLPDTSFRNADQIPLPEDPQIEAQAQEYSKDDGKEEEGGESPGIRELS